MIASSLEAFLAFLFLVLNGGWRAECSLLTCVLSTEGAKDGIRFSSSQWEKILLIIMYVLPNTHVERSKEMEKATAVHFLVFISSCSGITIACL